MELALFVQVKTVVAGADPIAVVIDQRVIQREKLERAINIQNRREGGFELISRSFVEDFAKIDQGPPRLRVILRFDRVNPLVRFRVIAEVNQRRLWIGSRAPSSGCPWSCQNSRGQILC